MLNSVWHSQGIYIEAFHLKKSSRRGVSTIGWREWLALPDLGIEKIKVKVDTGARSSSLHAFNITCFKKRKIEYVRFEVHPLQRSSRGAMEVEAEILDERSVRSSSGVASLRPVIQTDIEFMGERWPIELTLAGRDEMGFRMLLGREAIRNRFLVDAGKSFYGGRPAGVRKKKSTKKT